MNEQQTGVYAAINKVQASLAKLGISKDRKNQAQGYSFRGIDDVYAALSPLLSENGLCILPRFIGREVTKEINNKGTTLFYVVVEAEFDFVAVSDGSKHVVRTFGEAMDSGDKATNKAMSAAYKYAAFQAFSIPTEGDNDADAHTHQVVATPTQKPAPKPATAKSACWELCKSKGAKNAEDYRKLLVSMTLIDEATNLTDVTEEQWQSIKTELDKFYAQ